MSLSLNLDEFHRAAAEVVKHSERTFPEFVNGQALAVASRAIKHTRRTEPAAIALALGQTGTQVKISKSGKFKGQVRQGKRVFSFEDTLATRIVNARRIAQGLTPLHGRELEDTARRMIAARIRASGFIRSGWIYAVRDLSKAVGYSARAERPAAGSTSRMTGQKKGYAEPARSAINSTVSALIVNSALLDETKDGRRSNPAPIAAEGLSMALAETSRDMLEHLARKLQPVLDTHSAR